MKTRRRFLAEAGVVLSGLVLPGAAQAWGWRRRRVICPPAPCPSPCPPSPGPSPAIHREIYPGCGICLAPQGLIGQFDGIYYYDCCYCDECLFYDIATSTTNFTTPADCVTDCQGYQTCNNQKCICTMSTRWPESAPRQRAAELAVDVKLDFKNPVSWQEAPKTDNTKWGNRIQRVTPARVGVIGYTGPQGRSLHAVLARFEIRYKDGSVDTLRAAVECTVPPVGTEVSAGTSDPQNLAIGQYHRVMHHKDRHTYHVIAVP